MEVSAKSSVIMSRGPVIREEKSGRPRREMSVVEVRSSAKRNVSRPVVCEEQAALRSSLLFADDWTTGVTGHRKGAVLSVPADSVSSARQF